MTANVWVSAYRYQWTPILTFTRRRLELLEWIDSHMAPLAFRDEADQVGVAVGTMDLRLEVDRYGFVVRATDLDNAGHQLAELLGGMFEVLEPRSVRQVVSSSLWSFGLATDDYDERRAEFAREATFGSPSAGGFLAIDGSSLVDIESTDWRGQLEFGVVSAEELIERISSPRLGRIKSGDGRWDAPVNLPDLDELPIASLLVDASLRRRHGGTVHGVEDVVSTMTSATASVSGVVDVMMKKFRAGGEGHEFAQAE